jgi:hypothetical protein
VALLNGPEQLPAYERLEARFKDTDVYIYPSVARKLLITFVYLIIDTAILILLQPILLTDGCLNTGLNTGVCAKVYSIISFLMINLWFLSLVAIIILGWRGLLFGAQKRMKSHDPESS